jgi:hypothetical protein
LRPRHFVWRNSWPLELVEKMMETPTSGFVDTLLSTIHVDSCAAGAFPIDEDGVVIDIDFQ